MFSIGLVLLLATMSLAQEDPQPTDNSAHCMYMKNTKTLLCTQGERKQECPAIAHLDMINTKTYQVFGISRSCKRLSDAQAEDVYYNLYARKLNSTDYMQNKIRGKAIKLYYGEKFTKYGIRVTDMECYADMVNMFEDITDFFDAKIGDKNVKLIGEILIENSNNKKEFSGTPFLLGYGWGSGWGFGWGYGFPYYGWGYGYY